MEPTLSNTLLNPAKGKDDKKDNASLPFIGQPSHLSLIQIYHCLRDSHAPKIIENILKKNIDINYRIPLNGVVDILKPKLLGFTALHLAVRVTDFHSFKVLLDNGADFTIKNNAGFTPLHFLIDKFVKVPSSFWDKVIGNDFINSILSAHVKFEKSTNPCNNEGLSHFHIACMSNNIEAVKFFLKHDLAIDHSVNINATVFGGWTALHFAVRRRSLEIVKLLLDNDANRFLKTNRELTPAEILVRDRISLYQSMTTRNGLKHSALEVKVENGKIEEILRLLLSHKIEKNILTDDQTHFHAVCSLQDSSLCQSFQSFYPGSEYRIPKKSEKWPGYTALHFAAHCNIDTVKFFISKDYNMTAIDSVRHISPLHILMDYYSIEDICEIIELVPKLESIQFANKKTYLKDFILSMRDPYEFYAFLESNFINVNLPISTNSPVFAGFTPLHLAVMFTQRFKNEGHNVDMTLIEICLKRGADVTCQDSRGQTPIHIAFCQNKKKVVELLLKNQKTMLNPIDNDGLSHLHIACAVKNTRFVSEFVDYVDVNVLYLKTNHPTDPILFGTTPLHVAVHSGNLEIIKTLVNAGADVNVRDFDGFTPIHRALFSFERREIANILLSVPNLEDRVVNGIGLSHLHIACFVDNIDAVEKLLDCGADIDAPIVYNRKEKNYDADLKTLLKPHLNKTSLDVALNEKNEKTIEVLLRRNADIFRKKQGGVSILIAEILTKLTNEYEAMFISKLSSDKDLQKKFQIEANLSPLHVACVTFDFQAIADLLKTDVDVNLQTPMDDKMWPGNTPLHLFLYKAAVRQRTDNFGETLKMLLEKGAKVTVVNLLGYTPIHHYGYRDTAMDHLRLLLDYHQDFTINPTDRRGLSHFHCACLANHVEVVKKFLESKVVDVNQQVDVFHGRCNTPLDHAIDSQASILFGIEAQLETIDLLLKNGANPHIEDTHGRTAVHSVAQKSPPRLPLLEKFAEYGVDINKPNSLGETPFEALLKSSNVTIEEVDFFLKHGCQVNNFNPCRDEGYMSMLISKKHHLIYQAAVANKILESSNEFLKNDDGRTVIHNMVATNEVLITTDDYENQIEKFRLLGVDVDEQDKLGKTALHLAAHFGNKEATNALLRSGADVNIVDVDGKSAFSYAIESRIQSSNRERVIKSLADYIHKLEYFNLEVNSLNQCLMKDKSPNVNKNFIDDLNEYYEEKDSSSDLKNILSETGVVASYSSIYPIKRARVDHTFEVLRNDDELTELKGILRLQYRKALARLKLIESAVYSLGYLLGCWLPDRVRRNIIRFLRNLDLTAMIAATTDMEECTKMDVD